MWYDKTALLSHNKILNMVMSNRGGGKTFNMTKWAIDDFKRKKNECVWVRRYQTEIDEMTKADKFFSAIKEYYPNDKFTISDNIAYMNDEPFVYFIALSTSRQQKSNNFPRVNKIIFDEFIIDKGRITYLKGEVEIFLDLYETVARTRDNVRAVLLANAITVVNPYFLFFNIKPKTDKRFTVQGQICVELFTDEDFIKQKKESRFGQLVNGTRYGDYAIDNQWLLDNDTFVEDKTPRAEFMLSIRYDGVTYGFWVDYSVGLIYVNRQYDPSHPCQYCLNKADHAPNLLLIKSLNDNKRIKRVIFAFRNGLIRFSDVTVKAVFYEYIGLFVR